MSKYRSVSELNNGEVNRVIHLLINGFSTESISEKFNVNPDEINTIKESYIQFKLQEGESNESI